MTPEKLNWLKKNDFEEQGKGCYFCLLKLDYFEIRVYESGLFQILTHNLYNGIWFSFYNLQLETRIVARMENEWQKITREKEKQDQGESPQP